MDKDVSVEEYIESIPAAARHHFDILRNITTQLAPEAQEVLSYGIIGYKVDDKRARVFISGWHDHVAIYPVPNNDDLQLNLQPYIRGKGTLWFKLDEPLPEPLIVETIHSLLQG